MMTSTNSLEISPNPPVSASPRPRVPLSFLPIPLIFGLTVALACYFASDVSLGLFFGPILLLAFIVPPLTMAEDTMPGRLAIAVLLTLGAWAIWLLSSHLSAFDEARIGAVLFAYVVALAGISSVLERVRLGKLFAAGVTVFLGALWLTWPIWLCPWLRGGSSSQSPVDWLTPAHPLMAMNSVVFTQFNFWDRYTLAYQQLTTLNQDMLYALPRTIAWMVGWHFCVGMAGLYTGQFARRRK